MHRRKPLRAGQKSVERGSTFKPKRGRTRPRPDKLDTQSILENNPPLRRGRRESSAPGANGWTRRVFSLYGPWCVVCSKKAVHAHHAVPARTIEAREGVTSPLIYDARNGVPVCVGCHERHEKAFRRIPRAKLPPLVIQWAYDHGFDWFIDDERVYPTKET